MIHIINPSTDPYFNLALEEYLLLDENHRDEYFMLWQDRPVVVVGRNQNTLKELNLDIVRSNGVEVVRRLTGGGAVYHDQGNLNFTYIVNDEHQSGFDFARFTIPIIDTLAGWGIHAENTGRNDITIKGKKFSGNAQYRWKNRLLHHGTLMFDCSIEDMTMVLKTEPTKLISKGVDSVRSRVTNIKEHLPADDITLEQFKTALVDTCEAMGIITAKRELDEKERQAVEQLRREKYLNWDWIYGSSPPFNVQNQAAFAWGQVELGFDIKNGVINTCQIYGDFFSHADINQLCQALQGLPYQAQAIKKRLAQIDIKTYFPAARTKEIIALFTENAP